MAAKVRVLRTETVPIESVQPHPENARKGSTVTLERSLREHSQYAPIIVHEYTRQILKGNNTWRVLREKLGRNEVWAAFIDCSAEQARAILAIDNRSSDDASYDDGALAALLSQVEADGMLPASGYTSDDLADLLAGLAVSDALPEVDALGGIPPVEAPAPIAPPATPTAAPTPASQPAPEATPAERHAVTFFFSHAVAQWVERKLSALSIEWETGTQAAMLVELIQEATGEPPPRP